jgi:hypothetical protein
LHFEVRYKGQPQNPAKFLQAAQPVPGQSLAQSVAATALEQPAPAAPSRPAAKPAP